MRRFLPLLILALVLGSVHSALAAPSALVNGIKERYRTLESFSASFEQKLLHKESGNTETRTGTLRFKKPLLIRWETTSPSPELLVVTEKEIWDYLPDEEVAYRYSPDLVQDSRSIIQVLTGQSALDRDFDITEEGTENGLRKLHLYPKEPSTQMVEAFLWVDSSHLILRADIIDFYGNHNDVTFSAFKSNAGMPASTFRFTPPDGVDVEDRLKSGQPEGGLFN
ncbi:outer-membrane lipoprotein carrier protein LolA [uncultured Desulfovibrio sp.]|uniref:LolA family protein n=1 Tax=uncultured Desulfovibrio sp. TaxID=167968 RepID=UPI0026142DD8|nr:outer-membrane lipoprotein carrier protein LolA [uncultured Desulfovibrio sp.]